jgi:hypothetical protein
MKRFNGLSLSILYCTMLSLAGCGGSSSNKEAGPLTGYFTDSAVEGLNYKTKTQSGITDVNGAFFYQAGESVVFSIGDFVLGESATAAPEMSPFDLIPDATLPATLNELSPLMDSDNSNTSKSIAFRTLNNMLTFLQALDSDKDASNGITVADGMASILQSESVDFTVGLLDFRKIRPLKRIMVAAVEQGLISSGFIKQAGQALNHFYQVQEISNSFQSIATGNDVTETGNYPNIIYTYTYDANGNRSIDSIDIDGDNSPDEIFTYTYDANGNRLTISYDSDADSSPEMFRTFTYDANGDQLTQSDALDASSPPGRIWTATYDAYGNRLTNSDDEDGDGSPDYIFTNTYDANGNQLTQSQGSGVDGSPESISTYTYDANDNLLTDSYDASDDGSPEEVYTYTYDANDNLLTDNYYSSYYNGSRDYIFTYTYDDNGNQLTGSRNNIANGTIDYSFTATFDENDNRLTESSYKDGDDSPYRITTITYNANGNWLTRSLDSDGDNSPDYIATYTYDVNGNQLTISHDHDADSSPDSTKTFTYDANGNQLTESYENAHSPARSIKNTTYVVTNIANNIIEDGIFISHKR